LDSNFECRSFDSGALERRSSGMDAMSDLRPYNLEFTDGSAPRRLTIVAADIEYACIRARSLVRDILAHQVFGPIDPRRWRAIVHSDEEGRREFPFSTE
jgi:hypothetical protein